VTGGHFGKEKVLDKLRERYWWPLMYKQVAAHCTACSTCATGKGRVGKAPHANIPLPEHPWELIGIDFVGPLPLSKGGNTYIIVISDYLSRWVEAYAAPTATAEDAARALHKAVTRHGFPKRLLSDRGSHFLNEVIECWTRIGGVGHTVTPAYRPQTNGLTERCNGTIKRILKMYTNEHQTDWDEYLDGVLFAYRTAYQSSLRSTPFGILYGREARLPLDSVLVKEAEKRYTAPDYRKFLASSLAERRRWARECMDKVHDKRTALQQQEKITKPPKARTFRAGDLVMLHAEPKSADNLTAAFRHPWRGPYSVVRRVTRKGDTYELLASAVCTTGVLKHD
jgi:transposase InsO family protein